MTFFGSYSARTSLNVTFWTWAVILSGIMLSWMESGMAAPEVLAKEVFVKGGGREVSTDAFSIPAGTNRTLFVSLGIRTANRVSQNLVTVEWAYLDADGNQPLTKARESFRAFDTDVFGASKRTSATLLYRHLDDSLTGDRFVRIRMRDIIGENRVIHVLIMGNIDPEYNPTTNSHGSNSSGSGNTANAGSLEAWDDFVVIDSATHHSHLASITGASPAGKTRWTAPTTSEAIQQILGYYVLPTAQTNTYSYTLDASNQWAAVASRFRSRYRLTLTAGAGGSVAGGGNFAYNATPEITASPHSGYRFSHWTGDVTNANSATTNVNINRDNRSATAHFVKTWTLSTTILPPTGGTVSGEGPHDDGTVVEVGATPNPNWRFSHWEGDLTGSTNPATITMDADKSVTAYFENVRTLTTSVDPPGAGTVSGGGVHTYYSTVPVEATPASGYRFSHWAGDLIGSANPTALLLDNDKSITAHFVKVWNLNISVAPESHVGTVDGIGSGVIDNGAEVILTASPAAGWRFSNWSGGLSGAETVKTFIMTGNVTAAANFAGVSYTISRVTTPPEGGTISGATSINHHSTTAPTVVNVSVTPSVGYRLDSVTSDHGTLTFSSGATWNLSEVTQNLTVTASFVKTWVVTASVWTDGQPGNAGGSVSGAGVHDQGSTVELQALPNPGYAFSHWMGAVADQYASLTEIVNLTQNRTVTAYFQPIRFDVTYAALPPTSGALSGPAKINHADAATGNVISITASPFFGYQLMDVTASGGNIAHISGNQYQLSGVTSATTVTGLFALKTYTIEASAGPNGAIAPAGSVNVTHGTNQSFAITAAPGYGVLNVLVNGASMGPVSNYTFVSVMENQTIEASFAPVVAVPNVVGMIQSQASSTITTMGLVPVVVEQASLFVPAGSVIAQEPVGGTQVGLGATVVIYVSTGATVHVPNVVGQTLGSASTTLVNAGLLVGTVTYESNDTVPSGRVISQSPGAGNPVSAQSSVNLVISRGPALRLLYHGDNPVIALVGQRVEISVVPANAQGPPTFQWYRLGGSHVGQPIPSETSPTLLFAAVDVSDSGIYYCEASDGLDVAVSTNITLQVDVGVPALRGFMLAALTLSLMLVAVVMHTRRIRSTD